MFGLGDLFEKDQDGYHYFKDRTGDTFRWKSENVATIEIENLLSTMTEFRDVAVYGVTVPGYDGQAGMASIADPRGTLNIQQFQKDVVQTLPAYARPVFLRLKKELELTGNY